MKKKVLAIGAHPDDIEIGCGGTLRLLHEQGFELVHLIVTSGEEGSLVDDKQALSARREKEARRSAKIIGANETIFLRQPDGLTCFSKELKVQVISFLREIRPQILFTHSSSDHFPDHQIVHQLTMAAISGSSGPWFASAGGAPHRLDHVFGYEVWHPISKHQAAVNIDSTIDMKIKALEEHQSQTSGVHYMAAIKGLAQYRGAMTLVGAHAEVFEVLKSNLSL